MHEQVKSFQAREYKLSEDILVWFDNDCNRLNLKINEGMFVEEKNER